MNFKAPIPFRNNMLLRIVTGRQYQKRLYLENRLNIETCSAKTGNDTEIKEKGYF